MSTTVKDINQVADVALQRVGKSKDHREARYLHAALEVTDEWPVGAAAGGQFGLGEIALDSELAQALAEDGAFVVVLQNARLPLTNRRCGRIL